MRKKIVYKLVSGKYYYESGDNWPRETTDKELASDFSGLYYPERSKPAAEGEFIWLTASDWVEGEKYEIGSHLGM